jgi:hypothetical protein
MITDSNQVYFAKLAPRGFQEGITGPNENSPPQSDFEDCTYKSTKLLHHGINDYGMKVSITVFRS